MLLEDIIINITSYRHGFFLSPGSVKKEYVYGGPKHLKSVYLACSYAPLR